MGDSNLIPKKSHNKFDSAWTSRFFMPKIPQNFETCPLFIIIDQLFTGVTTGKLVWRHKWHSHLDLNIAKWDRGCRVQNMPSNTSAPCREIDENVNLAIDLSHKLQLLISRNNLVTSHNIQRWWVVPQGRSAIPWPISVLGHCAFTYRPY